MGINPSRMAAALVVSVLLAAAVSCAIAWPWDLVANLFSGGFVGYMYIVGARRHDNW